MSEPPINRRPKSPGIQPSSARESVRHCWFPCSCWCPAQQAACSPAAWPPSCMPRGPAAVGWPVSLAGTAVDRLPEAFTGACGPAEQASAAATRPQASLVGGEHQVHISRLIPPVADQPGDRRRPGITPARSWSVLRHAIVVVDLGWLIFSASGVGWRMGGQFTPMRV